MRSLIQITTLDDKIVPEALHEMQITVSEAHTTAVNTFSRIDLHMSPALLKFMFVSETVLTYDVLSATNGA